MANGDNMIVGTQNDAQSAPWITIMPMSSAPAWPVPRAAGPRVRDGAVLASLRPICGAGVRQVWS
jgi:hypothetical protein